MNDAEQIEKIRQVIMRYRELLDLVHQAIANGEHGYTALFKDVPEEERTTLPEKLLQREAAILALEDLEPLRRSLAKMRFAMRNMERDFEEAHDLTVPEA